MKLKKLTPSKNVNEIFEIFKSNFLLAVENFKKAELLESEEIKEPVLETWNNEGLRIVEKISGSLISVNDLEMYFAIISVYNSKIRYVVEYEAYDNMIDYILDFPKDLYLKLLFEGFIKTETRISECDREIYKESQVILKDPTKKLGLCYI